MEATDKLNIMMKSVVSFRHEVVARRLGLGHGVVIQISTSFQLVNIVEVFNQPVAILSILRWNDTC